MHIDARGGSGSLVIEALAPGATRTARVHIGDEERVPGKLYIPATGTIMVSSSGSARARIGGLTFYLDSESGPHQVAVDLTEGLYDVEVVSREFAACDYYVGVAGDARLLIPEAPPAEG